ncbi:hypothetical protein M9H77_27873 [Catharanthus roseus]|uniref:Uncharacterized protein n=1 Tax=Catharanthus roseus TaxID=4058 RepID=A0ACC0ADX9_CATRO|nr:hypothetical protein M9H77_27873 [Catharanthus roseus]
MDNNETNSRNHRNIVIDERNQNCDGAAADCEGTDITGAFEFNFVITEKRHIIKTEPIYYYKNLFTITDQNKRKQDAKNRNLFYYIPVLRLQCLPSFRSKQSVNKTVRYNNSNRQRSDLSYLETLQVSDLDTNSGRRTSFASSVLASTMNDCPTCSSGEEQEESLSNRWPQKKLSPQNKLSVSLSKKRPFLFIAVTYTVTRELAGIDEQVRVPKGRTENEQTDCSKKERKKTEGQRARGSGSTAK